MVKTMVSCRFSIFDGKNPWVSGFQIFPKPIRWMRQQLLDLLVNPSPDRT